MASHEQSVTRWAIVVMVVIVGLLAFMSTVLVLLVQTRDLNEQHSAFVDANNNDVFDALEVLATLEDCNTPGPRTPTEDDPSTGHECFDENRARTAAAIKTVVDADDNGLVDHAEILEAIRQLEGAQG